MKRVALLLVLATGLTMSCEKTVEPQEAVKKEFTGKNLRQATATSLPYTRWKLIDFYHNKPGVQFYDRADYNSQYPNNCPTFNNVQMQFNGSDYTLYNYCLATNGAVLIVDAPNTNWLYRRTTGNTNSALAYSYSNGQVSFIDYGSYTSDGAYSAYFINGNQLMLYRVVDGYTQYTIWEEQPYIYN